MAIISLIAALDAAGGLGREGQLLCHLPEDLQQFKALTLGKPIVMGRKTYQSIGRPLPKRLNIVLSHNPSPIAGVTVVSSLAHALQCVADVPEVMIIGGASVYAQALPLAQRLYLTRIQHQFTADVFFPEVDWSEWTLVTDTLHADSPYAWSFNYYERICKRENA
jgi:dihydrofolate reductase